METRRVYLDHAASTPLAEPVLEAMLPYLRNQFGNPSSIHHHGRALRTAIEQSRRTVAELLGAAPGEIVFMSGGTEADNMALKCACLYGGVRRIITSPLEHHAVLHAAQTLAHHHGIEVEYLTPDALGNLSLSELETQLSEPTPTLVSLMHGNNEIGTINDPVTIGTLCQQYGARFHSDTVQSLGLWQPNLTALDVHHIVGAAHKFNGPQGIGFLYAKGGSALHSLICGGGQERDQRAGTENVAGIVGLAKALEYTYSHLLEKTTHLQQMKAYMLGRLQAAYGEQLLVNGDLDNSFPSVLNVSLPAELGDGVIVMQLDIHGVSVSGGSACTSGSQVGSHVLAAMGQPAERIGRSVRFSFGLDTTQDDLDFALAQLEKLVPVRVAA